MSPGMERVRERPKDLPSPVPVMNRDYFQSLTLPPNVRPLKQKGLVSGGSSILMDGSVSGEDILDLCTHEDRGSYPWYFLRASST